MFLRDTNRTSYTNPETLQAKQPAMRVSKTFQDSNIFGYKDANSITCQENVKNEMQRPHTAHKKVIAQQSHMNEIFSTDDKNARAKLRKSNDTAFQPQYENANPTQKHISEFYGQHHVQGYNKDQSGLQSTVSRGVTSQPNTASERKLAQQQSSIFTDQTNSQKYQTPSSDPNREKIMPVATMWHSKETLQKPTNIEKPEDSSENQVKTFSQNRKQMDMQSHIFGGNTEIGNNPQPSERPKSAYDNKNEDVRRSHHLFSDLFGLDDRNYNYKNPQNIIQVDPMIPTNMPWSDARSEKFSPRKNDEYQTANDRKLADMASSLGDHKSQITPIPKSEQPLSIRALEKEMIPTMDHHQKKTHEMRSEIPVNPGSQTYLARRKSNQDECPTYDFDLKSIPKNMDYDALKKAFAGYHLVELKADRNQVSGNALGTGRVKIRANDTHDMLKLKHDMKEHGILMLSHFEKHNRTGNYRDMAKINWHDENLQKEERRLKSDFKTAAESKLKNLESEGEVFGSSKGVGKWDRKSVENIHSSRSNNDSREQQTALDNVKTLNWKKNIQKLSTSKRPGTAGATGSSRPPISQAKK